MIFERRRKSYLLPMREIKRLSSIDLNVGRYVVVLRFLTSNIYIWHLKDPTDQFGYTGYPYPRDENMISHYG